MTLLFWSGSLPATAAPVLFVNDSRGHLATLDVRTGAATFNAGRLFLSSTSNQLVQIDLSSSFRGMAVGPFGVGNVSGLATEDTGQLFGVSGTNIFVIDPLTGQAMLTSSFAGMQLGPALGAAFRGESVPEPAAALLILLGLVALHARRRSGLPLPSVPGDFAIRGSERLAAVRAHHRRPGRGASSSGLSCWHRVRMGTSTSRSR